MTVEFEFDFRVRQQTRPLADVRRDGHLALGCDAHGRFLTLTCKSKELSANSQTLARNALTTAATCPAATALTNGLTLVTRTDRDVTGLGATLLNPFKGARNQPRS
jgi:hypothetical protein